MTSLPPNSAGSSMGIRGIAQTKIAESLIPVERKQHTIGTPTIVRGKGLLL